MPSHHYERIPLADESFPPINHYFSGIPSTAPPSFTSNPTNPPHQNKPDAVPIMPQLPDPTDMSEWAASTTTSSSADLDAQREDTLVRLIDRVEELERRMDSQHPDKEQDIESQTPEQVTRERVFFWLTTVGVAVFMVWFMAIIVLAIMVRYRAAGKKDG